MKCLIVDDEYYARKAMEKLVSQWTGVTWVKSADSAPEAEELVDREPPDIILTDIVMPGMDGLELSQRILRKHPGMLIVILTGFSEFEYAKRAIDYGLKGYLTKPVQKDELYHTLEKLARMLASPEPKPVSKTETTAIDGRSVAERMIDYIQTHYHEDIRLEGLAKNIFFLSAAHLSRLFKQQTGKRFTDYLYTVRMEKAWELIHNTDIAVWRIGELVGYNETSYFINTFKSFYGDTPGGVRAVKASRRP